MRNDWTGFMQFEEQVKCRVCGRAITKGFQKARTIKRGKRKGETETEYRCKQCWKKRGGKK